RLSRLLSVQQFHLPRPCPPRPRQPVSLCLQSPKDVSAASVEGHPCQVFVRRPRLNNKASPQERSWSVAESLEALQFQRRKVSGFSGVRNLGIKHRRRPTVTSMKSNCGAPPVTSFNIEQSVDTGFDVQSSGSEIFQLYHRKLLVAGPRHPQPLTIWGDLHREPGAASFQRKALAVQKIEHEEFRAARTEKHLEVLIRRGNIEHPSDTDSEFS